MKRLATLAALTLTLPALAAATALTVWLWLRAREAGLERAAEYPARLAAIDGEVA